MKTSKYGVTGLKELSKQLAKFDEDVIKKAAKAAAKDAMKPVLRRAQDKVGTDTGALRSSIKLGSSTSAGKSKDRIAWAYVGAGGKGKKDADGNPTGTYVLPVHYGTSSQAANPFLEDAFVPHIRSILQDYKSELKAQTANGLKTMEKRAKR